MFYIISVQMHTWADILADHDQEDVVLEIEEDFVFNETEIYGKYRG